MPLASVQPWQRHCLPAAAQTLSRLQSHAQVCGHEQARQRLVGNGAEYPARGARNQAHDHDRLGTQFTEEDRLFFQQIKERACTNEQVVQTALAKTLLPVHAGRFTISNHAWDDPYKRLAAASEGKPFRLLTPRIGEVVGMEKTEQGFACWWETKERERA